MPHSLLPPFVVWYDQSEEYHHLKQEIFTHHVYYFETENPKPVIIDAGAHIGLSTLYFKKLFPDAQITAIEPHTKNFALLKKNVEENMLEDVILHKAALSTFSGETTLHADQSSLGWLSTVSINPNAWNGQQDTAPLTVPSLDLTSLLIRPVDLLKLDIEGAEQEVLQAAGQALHNVKHLIIEFHPTKRQSLAKLNKFLSQQGFSVAVSQPDQGKTFAENRLSFIEAIR